MAQLSGRWLAVFVLLALAVVATLLGLLIWKLADNDNDDDNIDSESVRESYVASLGQSLTLHVAGHAQLTIRNRAGVITNHGNLAVDLSSASHTLRDCRTTPGEICYQWQAEKRLTISRHQHVNNNDVDCYDVTWTAQRCVTQTLQDCYSLKEAFWYGGFQDYNQFWPMNSIQQNMAPYVAGDTWQQQYGDVLERLFVSSNGFGIYVDRKVPLYLSFNQSGDGLICLVAKYEQSPYFNPNNSLPVLQYQLCQGSDVRSVHGHMTSLHVPKPHDMPAEDLFRSAIWSTWAMYKGPVNQTLVLDFAHLIVSSGLPYSQLEIDDDWTTKYGDLEFNTDKFPDPKGMISQLNDLGFRLTLWVHPFFNLDSKAGQYAAQKGYLVKEVGGRLPALVSWWRGEMAFLLDVTNPEARRWFLNNTRHLQRTYNVTSFKFDAGESNWLPMMYSTHRALSSPDEFSRLYVEMAYRSDRAVRAQEVRVGTRAQHLPIMFRMLDRQTAWGYHRAIKTVIPCALTFGLIGYRFVLPDLIGGNNDEAGLEIDSTVYASPELYVRWLQVNTFLPFVQFSVGPWVYNSTIQAICKKFMDLRNRYTDTIVSLARQATRSGAPIVRPLWWIAPKDVQALTSDSQYLLGDDLLVAPVLDEGSRSRDVYLPAGTWRDETRGGNYDGPRWLRGYSADLDVLPFFRRL